jgi:uncharacterized protein YkwD
VARGAWTSFAAGLLAALALAVPATAADAVGGRQAVRLALLESSLLTEINAVRARHGVGALRASPALAAAANAHSQAMVRRGFFAHESADGSHFSARVRRYYRPQGSGRYAVGENLLWYSPSVSAQRAVVMWLRSPGHRANLLDRNWKEIGLSAVHAAAAPGAFRGREVTVLTADFGVRSG